MFIFRFKLMVVFKTFIEVVIMLLTIVLYLNRFISQVNLWLFLLHLKMVIVLQYLIQSHHYQFIHFVKIITMFFNNFLYYCFKNQSLFTIYILQQVSKNRVITCLSLQLIKYFNLKYSLYIHILKSFKMLVDIIL